MCIYIYNLGEKVQEFEVNARAPNDPFPLEWLCW